MSAIVKIQEILGVTPDGIWGPKSQTALNELIESYGWHSTTATSFADPRDLRQFDKCKANGGSDHECFAVGDNGIGLWGDKTGEGTGPCCALPSAAWHDYYNTARKKLVLVRVGERTLTCELRDTSGSRDVIDLNPDACAMLGLRVPVKQPAVWRWV